MPSAALIVLALACSTPPTATVAEPVPEPAPPVAYEVGNYPGTYLGICQRMTACDCPPPVTAEQCAEKAAAAIFSMRAVASEAGADIPEPTEEQLAHVSNGDCAPLCAEVKESFGF